MHQCKATGLISGSATPANISININNFASPTDQTAAIKEKDEKISQLESMKDRLEVRQLDHDEKVREEEAKHWDLEDEVEDRNK